MQFPHPDSRTLPANIQCTPPSITQSQEIDKVVGSLVGLALGDALGACVEFRPRQYLVEHPIQSLQGGGTWGLKAGQWTDDTSMALCLAASLITHGGFNPYDQMVRYKWWYQKGYLSSTGECFDIGGTTRASLEEFARRQSLLKRYFRNATDEQIDNLSLEQLKKVPDFDMFCGLDEQAGNGPLMRLAPVPLFYFRQPELAVHFAGESARLTHGDRKSADACRYYAALIVAAIRGEPKKELLDGNFLDKHQQWFGSKPLHPEVIQIAKGSFKKQHGYDDGIRGKNYIINTLEAALWAFWSDENSFENGALKAVNLGDDTDTTAAVYGQLAGACYGASAVLTHWGAQLYASPFLVCVAQWLYVEGSRVSNKQQQNSQRLPVPQSNQQKALGTDRVGYHPQRQQTTAQPSGGQKSSTTSTNNSQWNYPNQKQKLDPSRMPAAGVPSGFHQK